MVRFVQAARNFINDEEGASAVEYALIAALIAVVIAASVQNVGTNVNAVFTKISTCLTTKNCT